MKTEYTGITIPDYLIVMKWIENEGKCMLDLHNELGVMYRHLHYLKHTFIKLGWITIEKQQSRHNMYLTDKGRQIVNIANDLLQAMGYDDDKIKELLRSQRKKKNDVDPEKLEKEMGQYDNDNNGGSNGQD